MSGAHHLFLAPGRGTTGEANIGARLARALVARGDRVTFLVDASARHLLAGAPFAAEVLPEAQLPLLPRLLEMWRRSGVDAVVLCDAVLTAHALDGAALDPAFLLDDERVVALDIWDHPATGLLRDAAFGAPSGAPPWMTGLGRRLVPVPIAPPTTGPGRYDDLPCAPRVPAAHRRAVREGLGLGDGDRLVLFATSAWQQGPYPDADLARLGEALPALLALYLRALGPHVHLLHLGPAPYPLEAMLGDRYHALPPRPPAEFNLLFAAADLVVSANASSTLLGLAIAARVPAVLLVNERLVEDPGGLEALSPPLQRWLRQACPIPPFLVWPVGWHAFLSPLLRGNPFAEALARLDLLDEPRVLETLDGLLHRPDARAALATRQAAYETIVRALPGPAAAFDAVLG